MKEDKKEETMNPKFHWGGLDLQNRRNFSAFFGQTRQVRSDREVRVTLESRNEKKKKNTHTHTRKNTRFPYAHQDRETEKNILRIVNI